LAIESCSRVPFSRCCCAGSQWAFQRAKYALTPTQRERAGGDLARGFATGGPFKHSRHLNFFCEQSLWWVFYLFGVVAEHAEPLEGRGGMRGVSSSSSLGAAAAAAFAAGGWGPACAVLANPTALGPLLLSLLFLGSTDMTERLTLAKYPAYAAYQRTTSRLVPWLAGASLDSVHGRELVEAACAQAGAKEKAK
jgi:steroid 5-alpha reductase family enzyme